ncbi:MAG: hypothetical protein KDA92_03415 [Planctomycetales bacterium]|nr:hypothetical protein [Planctomycetales bacterium]MCA9171926.1 hypothetical protein [Planctomycetales bacterium]
MNVHNRFSLIDLLSTTALVTVAFALPFPDELGHLSALITVLVILSITIAFRMRASAPCQNAVLAGVVFFGICHVAWWTRIWIGYLAFDSSGSTLPYFEDGPVLEGVVAPVAFFVFWVPFVMTLCFVTSGLLCLSGVLNRFDRLK